jgi:hypothetical protein
MSYEEEDACHMKPRHHALCVRRVPVVILKVNGLCVCRVFIFKVTGPSPLRGKFGVQLVLLASGSCMCVCVCKPDVSTCAVRNGNRECTPRIAKPPAVLPRTPAE